GDDVRLRWHPVRAHTCRNCSLIPERGAAAHIGNPRCGRRTENFDLQPARKLSGGVKCSSSGRARRRAPMPTKLSALADPPDFLAVDQDLLVPRGGIEPPPP